MKSLYPTLVAVPLSKSREKAKRELKERYGDYRRLLKSMVDLAVRRKIRA